jgi:hypothetical protein
VPSLARYGGDAAHEGAADAEDVQVHGAQAHQGAGEGRGSELKPGGQGIQAFKP